MQPTGKGEELHLALLDYVALRLSFAKNPSESLDAAIVLARYKPAPHLCRIVRHSQLADNGI